MLKRLKHLYLLINALREMQADSFPMDSFYPLVMDVLRDAMSDVRIISSSFSPNGWEDGLRVIFSDRPKTVAQLLHLNRVISAGEVDNPVRAASLLGTALPLFREFYAAVRDKMENSEEF